MSKENPCYTSVVYLYFEEEITPCYTSVVYLFLEEEGAPCYNSVVYLHLEKEDMHCNPSVVYLYLEVEGVPCYPSVVYLYLDEEGTLYYPSVVYLHLEKEGAPCYTSVFPLSSDAALRVAILDELELRCIRDAHACDQFVEQLAGVDAARAPRRLDVLVILRGESNEHILDSRNSFRISRRLAIK